MNRIKPVTYILATVYFLVDAVFIAVAKPVGLACQALGARKPGTLDQITPAIPIARTVPVIILEPVKPVAAYLAATGQIISSDLDYRRAPQACAD